MLAGFIFLWPAETTSTEPVERSNQSSGQKVDFSRDVRPLLARNCFACHGPDAAKREAELRLDVAALATAPLPSGRRAVVPGNPTDSELLRRITTHDDDERMPPANDRAPLSSEQIAIVRTWIEQGAEYSQHWSFQAIQQPALPPVNRNDWPSGVIDQFILARLEDESIEPAAQADKTTLIRRLSLDLLGLPGTPEEVRQFENDPREDAYDRLVDRMLASPDFGQRWGRHWLDMARYADSNGYLGDELRPYAWLYRDWVIRAINDDMPFDQFTIEQFAGDLLPAVSVQQKIATAFLRNSLDNTEAGSDREENRVKAIVDRVSTLGSIWLGLSVACAECHAHKYDPITQPEFYRLFAFLNDADDVDLPIDLPDELREFQSRKTIWDSRRAALDRALRTSIANSSNFRPSSEKSSQPEQSQIDIDAIVTSLFTIAKKRTPAQIKLLEQVRLSADQERLRVFLDAEQHAAAEPVRPTPKVRVVMARKESRPTYVHERGDYRRPGELVHPGTLGVLPALQADSLAATRLDLAKWLVDSKNPLSPRVTANHIWRLVFGQGLVTTEDDFGVNGDPPSHPQLLDWIAHRLLSSQWSRKDLIRNIVLSTTYRQSSRTRPELMSRDPLNYLLTRQNRFRLESEAIRDSALLASGLLTREIGGRSIRPPQPAYITSISRNSDWEESTGANRYRRGLYILLRRATPYPVQIQFDAPESTVACTRRQRTNSPLQALTLLNDPVFVECAKALGEHLVASPVSNIDLTLDKLFLKCLGRLPNIAEVERMRTAYFEIEREMNSNPTAVESLLGRETYRLLGSQAASERATWIALSRIVMNLDEFITR